jgi:hypothetical protein
MLVKATKTVLVDMPWCGYERLLVAGETVELPCHIAAYCIESGYAVSLGYTTKDVERAPEDKWQEQS